MSETTRRQGLRLAAGPNEVIDRAKTIHFTFNGKSYPAYHGDTIASALVAAGVKIWGRSFKYHRPRGPIAYGHAADSMLQIGNEPSVSAWLRPVEDGLAVTSVNVWPSVDRDLMSLTAYGDRLTPVGFYYKTFIRPQALWPTFESMLRRLAGLGRIDIEAAPPHGYVKEYLHGDVVVVGAGPAGLAAAVTAAEGGARVLLFDEHPFLGGHLRYSSRGQAERQKLIERLEALPNAQVYLNTLVQSCFEDNWLAAVQGRILYKIRAKQLILATGALDQPLVFDNNDRPGVLLGSAVQRLLHLYGTVPGREAVIVTANDDGWELARDLTAAGVNIAMVVEARPEGSTSAAIPGQATLWEHTIVDVKGSKQVGGAVIAPLTSDGTVFRDQWQLIPCDFIPIAVAWAPYNGLLYQAGAKIAYDETRNEFLPTALPANVYAAGRVAGSHELALQIREGELTAQAAMAALNGNLSGNEPGWAELAEQKQSQPSRTAPFLHIPAKGKQFVDLDEDVTSKDVKTAIAEGYDSIELLKRYSTISMGPSQGKWSSVNTIHLTAKENDWSIAETGTTTARPPIRPIEMAALAGQNMEPVRLTPLHQWHMDHGAQMMNAGLWKRAEHYGDPLAEVNAVRQRVGLIDVSTLGKIRLTGPGVPDLLDKIYINKWQKLPINQIRYGVMCNDEGVILDDGVTARLGDQEWYMSTTSSGAASVYEWIQWWVQSGWGNGVHVTPITDNWAAFNLAGPLSRTVLARLTNADVSNEAFPYMRLRQLSLSGVDSRVLRMGFTGELSYEIHVPAGDAPYLWEAIMAAGAADGITPFGVEAQRVLRLEKAHIIVGQDTDALSDPIAANLSWAVKHDKPNFLGQRPLARIAKQGPKQKLVGFKMLDTGQVPEEGLQIVTGRAEATEIIGWVTSCRYSPTLNEIIGLCWLSATQADRPGAVFTIRREGSLLRGQVHHGPFYDPAGARLRS